MLNAVRSVFQTYEESLKNSGSFDESAQKLAFEKVRNIVINQKSEEVKNHIKANFGDLDNWIDTSIEATINGLKNKQHKI